ncbi:MAG TPA: hypothetical protein VL463_16205 [Kofleriaceae bacterium]|nr:hypothetical protein [Kofleriaceae bacterium]
MKRTEHACQRLNDACVAATDALLAARAPRVHEASRFVMDCWHVANATSRILGRYGDYEARTLAMLVSACRQVALQCAWACEMSDDVGSLDECARACEHAAGVCAELLGLLWDTSRSPPDNGHGSGSGSGERELHGGTGKTAAA